MVICCFKSGPPPRKFICTMNSLLSVAPFHWWLSASITDESGSWFGFVAPHKKPLVTPILVQKHQPQISGPFIGKAKADQLVLIVKKPNP